MKDLLSRPVHDGWCLETIMFIKKMISRHINRVKQQEQGVS